MAPGVTLRVVTAGFKDFARAISDLGCKLQALADTAYFYAMNSDAEDMARAYEAFVADGGDPDFIERVERAYDVES